MPPRVFLLSPANCGGERMRILLREEARFPLAMQLRSRKGAPIGEVFRFASGLYFRGKLAYAETFASHPRHALVITTDRGLVPARTRIAHADVVAMGRVPVDLDDRRYRDPLTRDARKLAKRIGPDGRAVLLGSIATGKYAELLLEIFGERLLFPPTFVGRGDLSRGGVLLRAARERRELDYAPLDGAVRHGKRPPRLARITARRAPVNLR